MAEQPREEQRTIDFRRADQLRILRDCELPHFSAKDGTTVTPTAQKAVLRAIDDHGRECFASLDTLARESNVGRRQVVRALDVLERQGVLIAEKSRTMKGNPRVYRTIVWSELALYCREELALRFGRKPSAASRTGEDETPSAVGAEPSAVGAEPSAVGAEPSAASGTVNELRSDIEATKEPPPPPSSTVMCPAATWAAAAEVLRGRIGRAPEIVAVWQSRRLEPEDLIATAEDAFAVAALPSNAALLEEPSGAIAWFLERGLWPVDGIITLAEHAEREERKAREAADRKARADAAAAQQAAERAASEARERKYGPIADALDGDELTALLPTMDEFARSSVLREVQTRPWSWSTRYMLIKALAARDEALEGRP